MKYFILFLVCLPSVFAISLCSDPLRVTPETSVFPSFPVVAENMTFWIDQGILFVNHSLFGTFPVYTTPSAKYDLQYSNSTLAWVGYTSESQIYLCRLNSSFHCSLPLAVTSTLSLKQHLDFDGRFLVWEEYTNQTPFLRGCDLFLNGHAGGCLSSDQKFSFFNVPYQKYPSLDKGFLAWQQYFNGSWQVFSYDFNSSNTQQVTFDVGSHYRPQIQYPYTFWHQYAQVSDHIFAFDLQTQQLFLVSKNRFNNHLVVSGESSAVVWHRASGEGQTLEGFDLSTRERFTLKNQSHFVEDASLRHTTVAYQKTNGKMEIYRSQC